MRICQVMIGAGFGGAERSFVDTALAMADRGHAVQAVCHRDFVKREWLEAHENIRVSPVHVRGAWDLAGARRMQRALDEFVVRGVRTNLALLHQLMDHPQVVSGTYDTGIKWDPLPTAPVPETTRRDLAAVAAVAFAMREEARQPVLPPQLLSGWHRASRTL